MEVDSLSIFCK